MYWVICLKKQIHPNSIKDKSLICKQFCSLFQKKKKIGEVGKEFTVKE